MTDSGEVCGEIFLKKNTIEFIQTLEYTLTDAAAKKLKNMDRELFQAEIKKFERQEKTAKYFGSIDYRDIIDVKYLCLTSMDVSEEECPNHDFHLQLSLRAVNGVSLKLDGSISEENEIEFNPQSQHPVANIYFKVSHKDEYGRDIP